MSNLPQFTPEGSYDPNDGKEYCSKSLFEQLQEQKNIKQKKFEEENSFKNSVKMYDEDDLAFVRHINQSQMIKELEQAKEIRAFSELTKKRELEQLHNNVNIYDTIDEKIQSIAKSNPMNEKMNLLKSLVKRKRSESADQPANKISKCDNDQCEKEPMENISVSESLEGGALSGLVDAYKSEDSSDDSDSSECSDSSEIDVGTLRPLINRLSDKIKKNS